MRKGASLSERVGHGKVSRFFIIDDNVGRRSLKIIGNPRNENRGNLSPL